MRQSHRRYHRQGPPPYPDQDTPDHTRPERHLHRCLLTNQLQPRDRHPIHRVSNHRHHPYRHRYQYRPHQYPKFRSNPAGRHQDRPQYRRYHHPYLHCCLSRRRPYPPFQLNRMGIHPYQNRHHHYLHRQWIWEKSLSRSRLDPSKEPPAHRLNRHETQKRWRQWDTWYLWATLDMPYHRQDIGHR